MIISVKIYNKTYSFVKRYEDFYTGNGFVIQKLTAGAGNGWLASFEDTSVMGTGSTPEEAVKDIVPKLRPIWVSLQDLFQPSTEKAHSNGCSCWNCK